MTTKKIGVGIIGLSARGGWAAGTYVPALQKHLSNDFEIRALSASTPESAQKAAKKYQVPHFSHNPEQLVQHPEVDLVIVSVKVPEHYRLVELALNAGKMVYCEWPLGATLEEAVMMDALAKEKKIKTFIGLQARTAPIVQYVRDLVQVGYVGEVLSTTMIGSGMAWGEAIDQRNQYLLDRKNGATLLSIPFGHSVDALCYVLGEFSQLTATEAVRRNQIRILETNEMVPNTTPDQVAVIGTLINGAVVSIHYRGGSLRGTNFHWEINGTKGDLVITGPSGHLQMGNVTVKGATGGDKTLAELPIPDRYIHFEGSQSDPSWGMTHTFSRVLSDIRSGTQLVPSFSDGVVRHRMLEAVEKAVETGQSQSYDDWTCHDF